MLSPSVETLTCFACGTAHDPDGLETVCRGCGHPLRVDIRLPVGAPTDVIHADDFSMWRYSEVLPVQRDRAVSLVEGFTPLIRVDATTWIKDETRNPTGSSEARGMSMAVSAAAELGAGRLVARSTGRAASALAAYGAAAGIPVLVAMPEETPVSYVSECRHYGAAVDLVPGKVSDAGDWLAANTGPDDLDVSTMREPYRLEGKKTMGYELFEQFGGDMPDVVMYPTGGGAGLVGMWKAWDEMERMGWIGSDRPRLVAVQMAECAPIVEAFEGAGEPDAPDSRVPEQLGGSLCLRAIRDTDGTAVAILEEDASGQMAELASMTGVDVCPEGGAVWSALRSLRSSGWIDQGERVVLFNVGTGLKDR